MGLKCHHCCPSKKQIEEYIPRDCLDGPVVQTSSSKIPHVSKPKKKKKIQQSSIATNSIKILSFPHQKKKKKKCTPLEENKVKVWVVIIVTQPQAKECWQPTEAASSKEWTFP